MLSITLTTKIVVELNNAIICFTHKGLFEPQSAPHTMLPSLGARHIPI